MRDHVRRGFLRADECAERVDPPVVLILLRRNLDYGAKRAAARVVEQDLRAAEALVNQPEHRGDLRGIADIGRHFERPSAGSSNLLGERTDEIRLARIDCDRIALREASRQCGAESGTDAGDDRDRKLTFSHKMLSPWRLLYVEKNAFVGERWAIVADDMDAGLLRHLGALRSRFDRDDPSCAHEH